MLTGIEIAGLVLGILPLVITIIQEREVGIKPVDAVILTTSGKRKVSGILSDQQLRFRFCCERLLCEVGIENVADYFVGDEESQTLWADPKLKKKIMGRLGDSYENFERKMQDIRKRSTRILDYTKTNRLLFSLKSLANGKDVIQLQESISMLREFVIDLPYRRQSSSPLPLRFDQHNTRCIELHRSVRRYWSCQCKERHVLYVEVCPEIDEDDLNLLFAADGNAALPIKNTSWTWQPALFKENLGSKSEDTIFHRRGEGALTSTTNLCEILAEIAGADSSRELHILSVEVNGSPQQLFADKMQPRDATLVTLQQELERDNGGIRMYSSGYLGVKDCLTLGILLLVTVLKYRLSPWLSKALSSDHVYFVQRGKELSRADLTKPFLKSGFFANVDEADRNVMSESSQISSNLLFEIGIMLLEIVHGNSFDHLMTQKERNGAADEDPEDRLMWRGRAALRLYKSFPTYMCLRSYKEVTERCLKNQFSDTMETDLFEVKTREDIYRKAIKPLLEDAARVI